MPEFYKSCDSCERHCRIMLWANDEGEILLTSGECMCRDRGSKARWSTYSPGGDFGMTKDYWEEFGEPQADTISLRCERCYHKCEVDMYGTPPYMIRSSCPFGMDDRGVQFEIIRTRDSRLKG